MFDTLTKRLGSIFSSLRKRGRLSESDVAEVLREVRVALLEADVNYQVAKDFIARIREKAVGEELFASLDADQTIIRIVRDELVELLGREETRFRWSPSPPTVVLLCGLQGSGKTTTAAKLAHWLARQGKRALLAACDVQRPAAITQLEVLGEKIGVPVFSRQDGTPPVTIARQAVERARHLFLDVVIVDTAGRLTIDEPLMAELEAIAAEVRPTEVLLVLDSTTGQEAVAIARAFHERLGLTGTIFTKLDGDARGGAVLSVRAVTGVPVRFVGVGEQVEALDAFYPDRMAQRILGMGDLLGIIEKAEIAFEAEQAAKIEEAARKGSVDFDFLLENIRMMRKMGPLRGLLELLPGNLTASLSEEQLGQFNEKNLARLEAIMLSMTPKERANPDIINGSRRKRIAAGSGTSVEQVNALLKQLYEMRRSMKSLSKLQKWHRKFGRKP